MDNWTGLINPHGQFSETENPPLTASSYGWRMGLVLLENGFPNGPFPSVSLSNALPRVTPSFSRVWQEKGITGNTVYLYREEELALRGAIKMCGHRYTSLTILPTPFFLKCADIG